VSQIYADLHAHSNFSDGQTTPEELLIRAGYAGLSVIALTDHDTVDGIDPFLSAASEGTPQAVPGVELSCTEGPYEIHLLGYWIDPTERGLRSELKRIREARLRRAERMVDRLRDHRIVLDFDEVIGLTRNGLVGRPHIAEAMVRAGHVPDRHSAFRLYLGDGKPAAVPKEFLTPTEGIDLIRKAGGWVSVAHPAVTKADGLLARLGSQGLGGLEVWHPKHANREIEQYMEASRSLGLVPTGGSDYHGLEAGATILGHYGLTQERYERVLLAAGRA
jgi:predicted metal-dependent phosphoesterase TrpH